VVRTMTYVKDSAGLFDYQGRDHKGQEFELSENGVICLQGSDIVFLKEEVKKKDLIGVMGCRFTGGNFEGFHVGKQYKSFEEFDESKVRTRKDFQERFVWRVIHNESGGEILGIGDIFKMGRMRFRVREINDERGPRTLSSKGIDTFVEYKDQQNQEEFLCRICMEPANPAKEFSNVCDCSKNNPIHADCLMDWVKTKMNTKSTDVYDFFTWKHLECDICKKPYPGMWC
jgi:hypothetical protein